MNYNNKDINEFYHHDFDFTLQYKITYDDILEYQHDLNI